MRSIIGRFKWRLVNRRQQEVLEDKLACLEQEVETLRQHDQARRHHLRLLDVLLNTIPEPVFFQDAAGVLQGCNLAFADGVVGQPRGKLLGQALLEIRTCHDQRLPDELFHHIEAVAPAGGFAPVEGRLRCADGREHVFVVSRAAIVASDGEVSGGVGVMLDITERKKAEAEKEALIADLREALATVKTLSGLLPVCSFCKKIRDDKGYWQQIEAYIQEHSEAVFSHSICQECARQHYPEIYADKA